MSENIPSHSKMAHNVISVIARVRPLLSTESKYPICLKTEKSKETGLEGNLT